MAGNVYDVIIRLKDQASGSLNKITTESKAARKGLSEVGGTVGSKLTPILRTAGVVAGGTVVAALGAASAAGLKMATDFEAGMANVATLTDASKEHIQSLADGVKKLSVETGKPLSDLTDGLYQTISAFGDTSNSMDLLEVSAKTAKAGLSSTTDALNLISAVTKGYGDTSTKAANDAADLALTTVKLGQTTFPELAASIGKVVPLSQNLGVSQKELFAVMATGTGVTGDAARVSTQYQGVLQSLMSPTKDMGDLYQKLGVQSGEALVKQYGLKGAMDIVVKAAKDSGKPLQKYIQSIEGQTLALALTGAQSDVYNQKLAAMGQATGATTEAFNKQQASLKSMEDQARQLGVVILTDIGEKVMPVVKAALQFIVDHGPAALDAVSKAFGVVGKTYDEYVKPVFDALIPILQVTLVPLLKNLVLPALGELAKFLGTTLGNSLKLVADLLSGRFGKAWEDIKAIFQGVIDYVKGVFLVELNFIPKTLQDISPKAAKAAGQIVKDILDAFLNLPKQLADIGRNLIAGLTGGIKDAASGAVDAAKAAADSVVDRFKSIFQIHSPSETMAEIGRNVLRGLGKGLSDPTELNNVRGLVEAVASNVVLWFNSRKNVQAANDYQNSDEARMRITGSLEASTAAGQAALERQRQVERYNTQAWVKGLAAAAPAATHAIATWVTDRTKAAVEWVKNQADTLRIRGDAQAAVDLQGQDRSRNANSAASAAIFAQLRAEQASKEALARIQSSLSTTVGRTPEMQKAIDTAAAWFQKGLKATLAFAAKSAADRLKASEAAKEAAAAVNGYENSLSALSAMGRAQTTKNQQDAAEAAAKLREKFVGLGSTIGKVDGIFGNLRSALGSKTAGGVISGLAGAAGGIADLIPGGQIVGSIIGKVGSLVAGVVDMISSLFDNGMKKAKATIESASQGIDLVSADAFSKIVQAKQSPFAAWLAGPKFEAQINQHARDIAKTISGGIQNGLSSGISAYLNGDADWLTKMREGVKGAIIQGITQAVVQGAIIKGALGGMLTKLTEQIAAGSWNAAGGTVDQIMKAIPALSEKLQALLAPLKDALGGGAASGASSVAPGAIVATVPMAPMTAMAAPAWAGPLTDAANKLSVAVDRWTREGLRVQIDTGSPSDQVMLTSLMYMGSAK